MKHIVLTLLMALGVTSASAQLFTGEARAERSNPKYLAGAVPVVDSMVVLTRTVDAPAGASADTVFATAKRWLVRSFARQEVLARKTQLIDSVNHVLRVGIDEYITFTDNLLNLDRSQMLYTLELRVDSDRVVATMTDITYYYEEERTPERYTAEEWITDAACLNRRGTHLHRQNGKFRIKTIDRADAIAASLAEALR